MGGGASEFEGAAYSRYFSRQNTSEDSANVTVSTVLAQSDSQSLHATPSYANTPTAGREQERLKSRSTVLLAVRPPAMGLDTDTVIIPIENEGENRGAKAGPAPALAQERLIRMTSTSTGSSVAPTGCCSAAKTAASRAKEKPREGQSQSHGYGQGQGQRQGFKPTQPSSAATATAMAAQSTGSDDEYRRRKRKYKRHHRCSDPALVYATPSGLQQYVHVLGLTPGSQAIQCPYGEGSPCDLQLDMELDLDTDADKIDDLNRWSPAVISGIDGSIGATTTNGCTDVLELH
ncbi:uncharacterized protein LOC117193815 [Drosophila miranda]|uniref:uncharacterized protein LOC117193815 n=1 Tax=Drosophila miranda TaxID=7229 RepID=UPI00143F617F|nr:uncharacterized protein LOC117193815 [Drosophila miranda]